MEPKEAAKWFRKELKDGKCSEKCVQCNANEIALKAIEKQIPKKVEKQRWVDTVCICVTNSLTESLVKCAEIQKRKHITMTMINH